MTAENALADAPRSLSDRTILLIIACYAAAFVLFGLALQPLAALLTGLAHILTTRDALLTDYFGVGGIGGGCVNAGLTTLAAAFVYWKAGARITGAAVACLFLMLGFGLFGKNLINVWTNVVGVYLYAKFRREPFASHINTAFFGAALAPVFSEILFSTSIPFTLSVPLAVVTSVTIGFVLTPAATQLFKAHMGFNLYNIGFTAGIVGTLIVALYKSHGFVPDPVLIWTTGNNPLLATFLSIVFASMIGVGYFIDARALARVREIMREPGQSPTDFVAMVGFGPALINMGLSGFIGLIYVIAIGGDLNGPVIGAILTIVGFAAFGKHPRNIVPIMVGVFLGSLAKPWNAGDPSAILAALVGTTLAPIAGRFGWWWGLIAGFVHASAVRSVGPLHAGLNLYNNGFAAGIVASVLVPVILALRAGFGYGDVALTAKPAPTDGRKEAVSAEDEIV
jgi:Protein of unknown function (DUF1576)